MKPEEKARTRSLIQMATGSGKTYTAVSFGKVLDIFTVWFLLIPSFLTLVLAALTVRYHADKSATANPAGFLRYE